MKKLSFIILILVFLVCFSTAHAWRQPIRVPDQQAGDILYFDGQTWKPLHKSVGKYLKSGASAPTWDTGGGESTTVSGPPLTLSGSDITFNYDTGQFELDGNNLKIKSTLDGFTFTNVVSITMAKQSGVAGQMSVYEANGTDTSVNGFIGADSLADDQLFKFPDADPVANSIWLIGAPSSNVSAMSYITLDDTGGDGDTDKIWTADKIYDELALKITSTALNSLSELNSQIADATILAKDADQDIWKSVVVDASAFSVDGTICTTPAEVTINSGPKTWAVDCSSDDAGVFYFKIPNMPENWDGGSIIIELQVYSDEASPSGTIEWDMAIQARSNDETINNTWVTTNGEIYFEDAETSNTTVDTQYDVFHCKNKTAMSASGAGGDTLFVKGTRDNDDGTHDTSTQGIFILGATVYYQIDDQDEKD